MSKTIIEVRCIDQVLTLTNTPVIASGGVGEDYVHFEFCEKWDGFGVSAVFWRKGVDCIPVLLDAENTCQVPPELMTSEGIVYFGAVGIATDGTTRTSEPVSYLIREGTITENTVLPMPGEDVYQQLMAYYADVKLYVSTRIDEAADAARAAEMNALTAAMNAQKAQAAAEDAVDAIEDVIYPGIVQATLLGETNTMKVTLDGRPPDKMFLSFKAPSDDVAVESLAFNSIGIAYPGAGGTETVETFLVREGYDTSPPDEAVSFGDVVTVLLVRSEKNEAHVLNPQITRKVLDKLTDHGTKLQETSDRIGELICAVGDTGMSAFNTEQQSDGRYRLMMMVDSVPVDGTLVRFVPNANSEDTAGLRIINTDADFDKVFGLVDTDGEWACGGAHTFSANSWVIALLDVTNLKAYVLNPAYDRTQTISYTGDGTDYLKMTFAKSPKVIQIESLTIDGFTASALLFRDSNIAKLRIFSDGSSWETFGSLGERVAWNKVVTIDVSGTCLEAAGLNRNNTNYVAIGFM